MAPVDKFNPFPGLRSFEPDEDHLFFGRETQIDELLGRLRRARFLAVVGTSGSGQSSLVRSGLIPVLHSGFMATAGSSWRVALGLLGKAWRERGENRGDPQDPDVYAALRTTLNALSPKRPAIFWKRGSQHLADEVCEIVTRNLTETEWRQYVSRELPYTLTCPPRRRR